jgi:hypothetical protein
MRDDGRAGSRRMLVTMTEEERLKAQGRHVGRVLAHAAKREERELEATLIHEDQARASFGPHGRSPRIKK